MRDRTREWFIAMLASNPGQYRWDNAITGESIHTGFEYISIDEALEKVSRGELEIRKPPSLNNEDASP